MKCERCNAAPNKSPEHMLWQTQDGSVLCSACCRGRSDVVLAPWVLFEAQPEYETWAGTRLYEGGGNVDERQE